MAIFSRKKTEKPTDSLPGSRSIFWGGPSTAGPAVDEHTALQTAAVYACVRVISEAIASLPLNIYRREGKSTQIAAEHTLYSLLHYAPNGEMTSFSFREALMSHLLLYGNAYAQVMRDGRGRVLALYPLLPDKMDVSRNSRGEIYYTYWQERDERGRQAGEVVFRKHEILHVPGLSFNGLVGYSPIAMAKNAIGMAMATESYGAHFFANSSNPSGILEHPGNLGDENVTIVRDTWDMLYRGADKSGRLAVLENGMKFHQISIPPEQAQFLETRKFQLAEIARIFRVPLHMIGDLDKSSFSNIEQQSLEFVKYTLDPWVVRWEQAMWQALLLPGEQDDYFIKFNLDGLLRGDIKSRTDSYTAGIQNGWLCPNDVRRMENQNEIPAELGGDAFMVNGALKSLSDIERGSSDA